MSTPTPAERAEQVLAETFGPPKPDQGQSMRRRVAVMFAQAIRDAEDAARKDERATCARVVASGIHCGAPPASIAAMIEAGAEIEPLRAALDEQRRQIAAAIQDGSLCFHLHQRAWREDVAKAVLTWVPPKPTGATA